MGLSDMKITVFGATGRIGTQAVQQALDAGHSVTAVVRDPTRIGVDHHPLLEIVTARDLTDGKALRTALKGSDAVISGVGPRGLKDGPVATNATRGILAAMASSGVKRLVAVSAVPVGPVPEGESFFNRRILLPAMSRLLRDLYADLTAMEDEIRRSAAAWTVVRPPKLISKPLTGIYRTVIGANVPRGYLISRADTVHLMLKTLADPATIGQPVGIAY
jgi:putative NADH-flavin reductase